ncbi:flagellar protein FlaG [Caldicellulosiruptor bescii]|uniref:Flagellar protein FlaG protein n=2 Tax=Caldicellulosiruptor bescii TaxID=31899 RepID=B9MK90_CALBD|nr:flagellar protein FlaG [Caldicellulosiruptor bescii]ACM60748.1 flagellar protein FlaG protein [Caldicellulosiruptor bescii DSM 6725]PBC89437.1 flagellar protein FlaG [Caldicellulosiruptor bescii]PBC91078.1 flagellar protein FlaG [Caldicellulosiruptor bescii]PBD03508.1 flagellar protein FlaG [Caldicellulosiruptor bescii]PBD06877.1 flagellar protein FlaG [Caldicellulosiruptor bescii]
MVVDGIGVKTIDISNVVLRVQDNRTRPENIDVSLQEEKGINKEEVNDKLADKNSRKELDEDTLIKMINQANKAFEAKYTRLEFSIHKETHEIVVKVYDKETNELIREIPPEKILDIIAKLWELAGIFVDERR